MSMGLRKKKEAIVAIERTKNCEAKTARNEIRTDGLENKPLKIKLNIQSFKERIH